MLTTIITVIAILLTLLLFIFRTAFIKPARRETVYVCDICNSQDCVCRKKS